MRVGAGLPAGVPGASGQLILDWARKADEGPFASLAVADRYAYDCFDSLTTLSAAAAVTTRVRLATTIVIAPLRNTATLAKTAATVDAIAGGRLVLGLAVGAREDDYQLAKVDYHQRGRILTEQLASLRNLWESDRFGPRPVRAGGPEIRGPKPECPEESRSPIAEKRLVPEPAGLLERTSVRASDFGLHSDLFRISSFEFRISSPGPLYFLWIGGRRGGILSG